MEKPKCAVIVTNDNEYVEAAYLRSAATDLGITLDIYDIANATIERLKSITSQIEDQYDAIYSRRCDYLTPKGRINPWINGIISYIYDEYMTQGFNVRVEGPNWFRSDAGGYFGHMDVNCLLSKDTEIKLNYDVRLAWLSGVELFNEKIPLSLWAKIAVLGLF